MLKPTDFLIGNKVQARDQEKRKEAVLPLLFPPFLFGSDRLFSPLTEKGHLFIYFPAFRDTGVLRGNVHERDLIPMRGAILTHPHNS